MAPQQQTSRPPLGQHFLVAGSVERVLTHLSPGPEDAWIEIGPGHGEMTTHLTARAGKVVAIERDETLAAGLRTGLTKSNLEVIARDILQTSLPALSARYSVEKWRVYGSLPYYITSPILHLLFENIGAIRDAYVIVQAEVADRLTATPGSRDYGYLSVAAQIHAQTECRMKLAPGSFRPPPKVDSALVSLTPPGEDSGLAPTELSAFLQFVQTCFRQKRKTLRNNLAGRFDADAIKAAIKAEGLAPLCRAEELPIPTLSSVFHRVS